MIAIASAFDIVRSPAGDAKFSLNTTPVTVLQTPEQTRPQVEEGRGHNEDREKRTDWYERHKRTVILRLGA